MFTIPFRRQQVNQGLQSFPLASSPKTRQSVWQSSTPSEALQNCPKGAFTQDEVV